MGLSLSIRQREKLTAVFAFFAECLPLLAIPLAFALGANGWPYVLTIALSSGVGWWYAGRPLAGVTVALWRFVAMLLSPAVLLCGVIVGEVLADDEIVGLGAIIVGGSAYISSVVWSGIFAARSVLEHREHLVTRTKGR